MKQKLELEIENVFGGDGITRQEIEEKVLLERSQKSVRTRVDIGVPVDSIMKEKKTEEKVIEIQTFRLDEDGTPMLRLGGPHGKLWGALKKLGKSAKDFEALFNSYVEVDRLMDCVNVAPIWVRLENTNRIEIETLPQLLSGRQNTMITINYDVIPKCNATVVLSYPDTYKKKIKRLLELLPNTATLNKRRATIKVTSSKQVKE